MDYETKILLNKLVEAIDSPDWWAIGITAFNALIMAWLAWRQVKLQRQQTQLQEQQIRQQEYEIYNRLYKLVKNVDAEIDRYLDEIIDSLGVIPWKRAKDGFLQRKFDYFLELRNELEQNALDFEIKFSKEFFNLGAYRSILAVMIHNLQLLDQQYHELYQD